MSENVPFRFVKGLNEMRALNTTDRSISPGLGDGYANGTRPVTADHSKPNDPSYEHWCRPEPTREFPFKNAEADRYREKQGGMQDDTPGLKRAENGGVIGSQQGVIPPKGSPHFQATNWGEYNDISQWDKEQEHTYDRNERNEPFDD